MSEYLRLARPFFVLLGVSAVGRWMQSVFGVPYEKGTHVFSVVTLTMYSAICFGAFARRLRGFQLGQAALLGVVLGLSGQLVVLGATLLSYALGMHTYFNHPLALNVAEPLPFGLRVLQIRLGGLVVNLVTSALAGAIGWALGGLLPADRR
jgi:hypothetical protein